MRGYAARIGMLAVCLVIGGTCLSLARPDATKVTATSGKNGTSGAAGATSESNAAVRRGETEESILLATLRSVTTSNVQEKARAMRRLGEMGSTNAIPLLVNHIMMLDPVTASCPAFTALCALGTNAVGPLREFVLKADPEAQPNEIDFVGAALRKILGDYATDRWVDEHKDAMSKLKYQLLQKFEAP